ncbi:unnamed protein product [Orchesella dallaii]|uniref:PDZ domain-containing protein n=1 Tax=Orchesella dallaii TaxID=48710 RepID=A0ABP1RFJ2_9HEXA
MDFGSLMRKASERSKENRKKTFSISNISFTSGNSSTTVVRKSLNITLPRDLGIQQDVDSRILKVSKGGSAHLSGVIQVGDLVNVFPNDLDLRQSPVEECPLTVPDDEFVDVNIIYGVLHVENRPLCPLIVEVGNRNNTSLGLALSDSPGEKIRISSIQAGSLAERCGYLKPGDILISIQVTESEKITCSPYYTSFETAQIIKGITSNLPTVTFTIMPYEAEQFQLQQQHISLFNMLSTAGNRKHKHSGSGSESTLIADSAQSESNDGSCESTNFPNPLKETHERDYTVLSFSLWKDRLYEDWGFSLTDSGSNDTDDLLKKQSSPTTSVAGGTGSEILQIRPGGPAYSAGLLPGDRIIQINHQDVSHLESTMMVPILASLDDSLNIIVIRRIENDEKPDSESEL